MAAAAVAAVFVLSRRGDLLLSRNYLPRFDHTAIRAFLDEFRVTVATGPSTEAYNPAPVVECGPIAFCYARENDIYVACAWQTMSPSSLKPNFSSKQNKNGSKTELNMDVSFTKYSEATPPTVDEEIDFVSVPSALHLCHDILRLYRCCLGNLTEEAIRSNYLFASEIIEECADYSMIENTEPSAVLSQTAAEIAPMMAAVLGMVQSNTDNISGAPQPVVQYDPRGLASRRPTSSPLHHAWREQLREQASALSAPPNDSLCVLWRPGGASTKHERNSVNVEVIETINLLISSTGELMSSSISGSINMRIWLSGLPHCEMGILGHTDKKFKLSFLGFKFHTCINMPDPIFELPFDMPTPLILKFVPPEGEVKAVSYRWLGPIAAPFHVTSEFEPSGSSIIDFKITVSASGVPVGKRAYRVIVRIPVPPNTTNVLGTGKFSNGSGKAKYLAGERCIIWKIHEIHGGCSAEKRNVTKSNDSMFASNQSGMTTFSFAGNIELATTVDRSTWVRPPITVSFNMPMWIPSPIRITHFRIIDPPRYNSDNFVQYTTTSGHYQVRI